MEFSWEVQVEEAGLTVGELLRKKRLSQNLLKLLKQTEKGGFFIDDQPARVWHELKEGSCLKIVFPAEPAHPYIQPIPGDLDILFEDDHFLMINKPADYLSSPSFNEPESSIANIVLHYLMNSGHQDLTLHLVTRLDRQTSGVLIFAKHRWAHALMDQILRKQEMEKYYVALTPPSSDFLDSHGFLDFPIARSQTSLVERVVAEGGKPSLTEYWRLGQYDFGDLFQLKLHTGRTHQIRVHFAHVGLALLGDSLYGKLEHEYIQRQALHCQSCAFLHPYSQEWVKVEADLPEDMASLIQAGSEVGGQT